ncbi:hypothetical protein VTO42DRAFT_7910 [Malbranchea cinnamomea]
MVNRIWISRWNVSFQTNHKPAKCADATHAAQLRSTPIGFDNGHVKICAASSGQLRQNSVGSMLAVADEIRWPVGSFPPRNTRGWTPSRPWSSEVQ